VSESRLEHSPARLPTNRAGPHSTYQGSALPPLSYGSFARLFSLARVAHSISTPTEAPPNRRNLADSPFGTQALHRHRPLADGRVRSLALGVVLISMNRVNRLTDRQ
jgi:hypothetical protein